MRLLPVLITALALVIAGCGGDDDDSSSSPAKTSAPAATQTSAAASGDTVSITLKNIQFSPKAATVKVGQKVVWTNEDSVPHNVVGGPIKSDTFNQGETFEYTPDKAGTIDYVCTIHPGMTGKLTVTK